VPDSGGSDKFCASASLAARAAMLSIVLHPVPIFIGRSVSDIHRTFSIVVGKGLASLGIPDNRGFPVAFG
jgi:hypothetical protein